MRTHDVRTPDGRTLRAHDHVPDGTVRRVVVWHHGTPNVGAPPGPLLAAADRWGVRLVGHDRPGYGGSSPRRDRSVASAAEDVAAVADALGLERFTVMSHSGGGPHALACAALLTGRVTAALVVSGLAPRRGPDDAAWFAGMAAGGEAGLRAAAAGRASKEAYEAVPDERREHQDVGFTAGDLAALGGDWAWFLNVVRPALAAGPGPLVDDDLAYVRDWGFAVGDVGCPVELLHGDADRVVPLAHAHRLAAALLAATLTVVPGAGHVDVMRSAEAALGRLVSA